VRVRSRRQYQRIAKQATRYVGEWIIVDSSFNRSPLTRLGITASKYYGEAVQRNRFKRIVREAFRLCRHRLRSGLDLNVKPKSTSHSAKTADITEELIRFFGL